MEFQQKSYLIDKVADWIVNSKKTIVFTGAGISTESGIPDFRSPGGLWDRYDPELFTYQRYLSSREARKLFWQLAREFTPVFNKAEPNPAHYAIVELEKLGKLDCVITQNVDNLHQRAGTSPRLVIELHGTVESAKCLSCGKRFTKVDIQQMLDAGIEVPECDQCQGIIKQETIAFGEPMPVFETAEAERRSRECDLFIVVGSSLVVYPAAQMPAVAKRHGAKLVIINMTETDLDYHADAVVNGKAGYIMSEILTKVKERI